MDDKRLDKALEIYAALITGTLVSRQNPETRELYEEYYSDSVVYEITTKLLKKLNLSVYEYNEAIYITAGEGNRVFGYNNEDMKRMTGVKLNRELYMIYFIIYNVLLLFYHDSATYQTKEYVKSEDVILAVSDYLVAITSDISVYSVKDVEKDSFKALALLWDELPPVTSDDKEKNRASRASRTGYVKLTFNFLITQKLFIEVEGRYYPTDRFKAVVEYYFEEYRGNIYRILGGEADA